MPTARRHWSTEDELKFLNGLGKHAPELEQSRETLLPRYRMSLDRRRDWTGVDKNTILRYLDAEITKPH